MDLLNSLDQYAGDAAKKTRLGQMLSGILSPGQAGGAQMQAPSATPTLAPGAADPNVKAGGLGRPGAKQGGGAMSDAAGKAVGGAVVGSAAGGTGLMGLLGSL